MSVRETDPKLEFLSERYGFEAWSSAGEPPESLFIWKYFLSEGDLPGYRSERVDETEAGEGWPRSIRSLWRSQDEPEALLSAFVFEAEGRDSARALLLRALGQFQSTLQPSEGIGDVGFAAAGEGAIVFALANLVIVLRTAGGKPFSMVGVAQRLEGQLRARPEVGGKVVPDIEELALGPERPDGTLPLSLRAVDPLGRPVWFKVFSAGGESLTREGELIFRPYGPGPPELTVFTINENGYAATRSLSPSGAA
jgi:hypothetical protein